VERIFTHTTEVWDDEFAPYCIHEYRGWKEAFINNTLLRLKVSYFEYLDQFTFSGSCVPFGTWIDVSFMYIGTKYLTPRRMNPLPSVQLTNNVRFAPSTIKARDKLFEI
jgi:hypothetical protein